VTKRAALDGQDSGVSMGRREFVQSSSLALLAAGHAGALAGALFGTDARALEAGPRAVREIENTWIKMPDGTRLAARIWLPEGAERERVPAIWNYCPYLKRSLTRLGDDLRFPYYASHGYACVRVDIRGSGDSDGRPMDEYVRQEQDDALEVIRWIAEQPWCTGAVGMEGISWSGINSLQVAARRPPALKAIITHCSTDDRYADDAHYKGGAILHDQFGWGAIFWTIQGMPEDPAITGAEGWRERWIERLNAVELNLATWLAHPTRDAFWKHASVCEDYGQIQCPVYAIGGWVDAYKNTVFRLLEHLKVPAKGLVGPWTHTYPHTGVPGPAIGYLDEALRWWDHWLKGKDTGILREPKLRVWMQDRAAFGRMTETPGRWVAEESWPSPRIREETWFLNPDSQLSARQGSEAAVVLEPLQTVGLSSGNWCPSGGTSPEDLKIEMAQDQRLDDARSLTFDSEPLAANVEMLGSARVALELAVDRPVALVAVRLNEVAPSGESNRVTYGILNLTHRDSHENPTPLEPGRRYRVELPLDNAAHVFSAGSRIRVSVSTAYWPLLMPSPEPVTLTVFAGPSALALPVRPARAEDAALAPFGPPIVPEVGARSLGGQPGERIVEWDVARRTQTIRNTGAREPALILATNTEISFTTDITYRISDDDPTSAVIDYHCTLATLREDWKPHVDSKARVSMTREEIVLTGELNAFLGEERILTRRWDRRIPRYLV
jgi:putative CocE/NonD family hydrolase